MNLPNRLTVTRFFLTIVFVAVLSSSWRFAHITALLLFVTAGVTDYLDGHLARTLKLVTDFGKLMDPLADKIMMAAAFICLIPREAFTAWVAIVIISREFLITGLRLLAASKGVILPAEQLGKHKMAWQVVTVCYFLLLLSIRDLQGVGWIQEQTWWVLAWSYGGGALTVAVLALTTYSGLGYLWKNRALLATQ